MSWYPGPNLISTNSEWPHQLHCSEIFGLDMRHTSWHGYGHTDMDMQTWLGTWRQELAKSCKKCTWTLAAQGCRFVPYTFFIIFPGFVFDSGFKSSKSTTLSFFLSFFLQMSLLDLARDLKVPWTSHKPLRSFCPNLVSFEFFFPWRCFVEKWIFMVGGSEWAW